MENFFEKAEILISMSNKKSQMDLEFICQGESGIAWIGLMLMAYFGKFSFDALIDTNDYSTTNTLLNEIFPEEYISNLEALQKRWRKQRLTTSKIKRKTFLCIFSMLLGLLRCKIENLRL